MTESGQGPENVVTHVNFRTGEVLPNNSEFDNIEDVNQRIDQEHQPSYKKPLKKHLTRRQKLMHRFVAPLAFALGIGAVTHAALDSKRSSEEGKTGREIAIEMALGKGMEPTKLIPEVSILDGARFRNKPTTSNSTYLKFSDISEINGISIKDSKGVNISFATVVKYGRDPDGEIIEDNNDNWVKVEIKPKVGSEEVAYVSISDETSGIVIPGKEGMIALLKDPIDGEYKAHYFGEKIGEDKINQTEAIKELPQVNK